MDGEVCRTTEDVLPLSVRLDTECETVVPSEETFRKVDQQWTRTTTMVLVLLELIGLIGLLLLLR